MTELERLKEMIEGGCSIIEAYENVDLDQMKAEGRSDVADVIQVVLNLVEYVNDRAEIE